jgi:hypothetical protein
MVNIDIIITVAVAPAAQTLEVVGAGHVLILVMVCGSMVVPVVKV